jgi:hypothetical protein
MQGFTISAARNINTALGDGARRRRGKVFTDRYHVEVITTPTRAHHAISYVLSNWRKHGEDRDELARTWLVGKVGAWRLSRLASESFHAPPSEPGMHLSLCTRLSAMNRVVRWSFPCKPVRFDGDVRHLE